VWTHLTTIWTKKKDIPVGLLKLKTIGDKKTLDGTKKNRGNKEQFDRLTKGLLLK